MAATTATYLLPYPQGTDEFCDGWSYVQQLAERTDVLLDDFDASLAALQQPPAARVSAYSVEPLLPDPTIPRPEFNTIDFDTTGMVDLALTPTGFVREVDGFWFSGGIAFVRNQVDGHALGTNTVVYDAHLASSFGGHTAKDYENGTDPGASMSPLGMAELVAGEEYMSIAYAGAPLVPPRADVVALYALRLSDY